MNRRQFLQSSAAALPAALSWPATHAHEVGGNPWYQGAYRRNVIDMHITDWDERFLSQLDPQEYVRQLCRARIQSAVVYAHSHVGLCYFPTKVGHTHRAMKEKDLLGQIIEGCHRHGIHVVLYYSAIFDRWAYEHYPDWRIRRSDGSGAAERSRHGLCCPNSPYREYVVALIGEIARRYDFEGIRFDMVFWPAVCYCPHCKARFATEVGGELPRIINWEDPGWVRFQRRREEWLVDFARLLTATARKLKPGVTVEHQASTYTAGWQLGVTEALAGQNDFLQGDFYGDALQGSFVRKLFYHLSPHLPYGFETSVMASISNHTAIKPKELLETKACACLADGGAFVFIDAIDPVGTLNPEVYEMMGAINRETQRYESYLEGRPCQDVAVYLSTESKFDFTDNGKAVDGPNLSGKMPHVEAAVSVCKSLRDEHILFGVITKKSLPKLPEYQALILPNVLAMDREEVTRIRDYVRRGGTVYASKYTSLTDKDGQRHDDFLLADLFGVSFVARTKENYAYLAPVAGRVDLFPHYSSKHPLGLDTSLLIVRPHPGAKVLATVVLPFTDPSDPSRYASIHSNPPGRATDHPGVVLNQFGKGRAVYVCGELENSDLHRQVFVPLLRLLCDRFSLEAEAPRAVEITLFRQEEKRRVLINLVNFQKELPNIPVDDIQLGIRLGAKKVKRLVVLPEHRALPFHCADGMVRFRVPHLSTFLMLALDHE